MKQKLSLKNRRGQNIVGELEFPKGDVIGTVVIQHGHGQSMKVLSIQTIKKVFLTNNFQTVIFDSTNADNNSDGTYEKSRVGLHADDLEDVSSWVQKQDWFMGLFALAGKSLGGYSVIKYAERFPYRVDLVFGLVPFISGKLAIEQKFEKNPEFIEMWKKEGFYERESGTVPGLIRRLPWEYVTESLGHDLIQKASQLTMPILLVAGEKDVWILPEHVEKLFKKIPKGNKTFKIMKDVGHDFRKEKELEEKDIETLSKIIDTWLKEQLKKVKDSSLT